MGIHRALQPGGVGRAKHVVARAARAAPAEREAFDRSWLGYTETFGAPDLREAIAATYEKQQTGNILCFAGAEEGLFAAMQALLDRDSHAIVVTPNYQSAETVPLSLCAVTGIPLDPERGWRLEIDRVAAAIRLMSEEQARLLLQQGFCGRLATVGVPRKEILQSAEVRSQQGAIAGEDPIAGAQRDQRQAFARRGVADREVMLEALDAAEELRSR